MENSCQCGKGPDTRNLFFHPQRLKMLILNMKSVSNRTGVAKLVLFAFFVKKKRLLTLLNCHDGAALISIVLTLCLQLLQELRS